jgi:filamentous hemagglutinin
LRQGDRIIDALPSRGTVTGTNAPNRTQLIDDLVADGTRITPENVVDIRRINGRTVWLETGTATGARPAGLNHIIAEHGTEFTQRGISQAEIPDVVFTALQRNNVVGYQGRGTGRPIYEFDYGGQTHRLAITVGDNGFVVGANFR